MSDRASGFAPAIGADPAGAGAGGNDRSGGNAAMRRIVRLSAWKLSLLVSAGFLLVMTLLAVAVVRGISENSRARADQALRDLAMVVAANVDGDLHRRIVSTDQVGSEEYASLLEPLVRFRNAVPAILNLYTLRHVDGELLVVLDTGHSPAVRKREDPASYPAVPMEFDLAREPELIATVYGGGVHVDSKAYDASGTSRYLRSVEAPIRDGSGEVVAVLAVDYDESMYRARAVAFRPALAVAIMLCMPVLIGIGALLYWMREGISEALRELDREIITDPLTGLFNRRFFDAQLHRAVAEARRRSVALCVLLLDVDRFKRINDQYGHQMGDEVLRRIASRISSGLRQDDYFCRTGGEEFALLMPGATADDAEVAWRRISNRLREPLKFGGTVLTVTVSGGIASLEESDADQDELLRRADRALYRAKSEGRDRVISL